MGKNNEGWTGDVERRRAEIDASIATLDKKWIDRFRADVEEDARFEHAMLARAWGIAVVVFFLAMLRRLFS
jgi:hypothetical protein